MKNKKGLIAIIAVIAIIVITIIGTYNSLVSSEEKVNEQAANVDVMLQRRADLIPNLVSTVKGYASHENAALDKILEARQNLINANSIKEQSSANTQLTKALNGLMVVVENYPDLKASANFINLQDELAGTENRIATALVDYNKAVNDFNTKIKRFPTNLTAGILGFEKKELFEAKEGASEVPDVNFD